MNADKPHVFRVSKTIDVPLRFVYGWCTDFREDDSKITGSKSKRKIFEKTKKRVVMAVHYKGADGKPSETAEFITLEPPNSWRLDFFGDEDNGTSSVLTNQHEPLRRIFPDAIS